MTMMFIRRALLALFAAALPAVPLSASEMPRIDHANGRYTLVVDGQPYFELGAQVGNSSAWPETLDTLWPKAAAMHLNTLEVPVYWQQMEPTEGTFDDSLIDAAVNGARAHHLRLVLLWFGTWKNGKMHYVPEWVASNTTRFPRTLTRDGEPIDVLSANAPANLAADSKAFAHLMYHLKQIDAEQHTVILVQVENECGSLGSVRDFSAVAQKLFNAPVPVALTTALHKLNGTWQQVFGNEADESFQAWSVATYVNAVAAAGKREFPLPMYVNNWLKSPRGYPILTIPGNDYPSGGPTANMLSVWKAGAPAIDILAPDIYVPNTNRYISVMDQFRRPDNPLFIPETQGFGHFPGSQGNARNLFLAIGAGAIGFSPFGLDAFTPEENGMPDYEQLGLAYNYTLLEPMSAELARLQFAGSLQTAVERPGIEQVDLTFGDWAAEVTFPPAYTASADVTRLSPSAALHMGRVLVAQLGPDDFLVAGIDARVNFRRLRLNTTAKTEFLRVEEGHYTDTIWSAQRLWNGDETDAGLNFKSPGNILHVHLGTF